MKMWQQLARLRDDRSGNFGIMTAILLPVLLGVGGVALDLTNMMMSKTQLQEAADSASLAAATALANGDVADEAAAEALAKNFFLGQMGNYMGADAANALAGSTNVEVNTTTSGTSKKYTVAVGSSYNLPLTPLMGVLGYETMNIASSSVSTSGTEQERSAMSMYLVLDRSGSMSFKTEERKSGICENYTTNSWPDPFSYYPCYIRKIEALQTASQALFKSLSDVDPDKTLVRLGASSYTDSTQKQEPMGWGVDKVKVYVNALPYKPTGGTDATGAMEAAYNALEKKNTTEAQAHTSKHNDKFDRFILLMTDGEMTGASTNWNSTLDTNVRKKCLQAKEEGIVIFSVAFMAPTRGQQLLNYCASGTENYFQPDTMDDLIAAFDAIGRKAAKSATRLTN